MSKEEIFGVIRKCVVEVLGDGVSGEIALDKRLDELGADSIDRADIMVMTIEKLGLRIPLVELGRAKTIRDLTDILISKTEKPGI